MTFYDDHIEQEYLASIIVYPEILLEYFDAIKPEDLFNLVHRDIYLEIEELKNKNITINALILIPGLKKRNTNIQYNGYLAKMTSDLATTYKPNIERNIKILKDLTLSRRLMNYCEEIKDKILNGEQMENVMEIMQNGAININQNNDSTKKTMKDIGFDALERIDRVSKIKNGITGVPSGFDYFDNLTGGFQSKELWILAARPGMGKTALALQMIINMGGLGYKPYLFSIEMSSRSLYFRQLSTLTGIDLLNIIKARINPEEVKLILKANETLSKLNLIIDDSADGNIGRIITESRKAKLKGNADIIFIDHLQLTQSDKNLQNRNLELGYITHRLKGLSKELDVPVVVLSQLSRKVEDRLCKKPILSDLRESGDIEQNADVVLFIYREQYYNKEKSEKPNIAELIFEKYRNGPAGKTIELSFIDKIVKFTNLEKHMGGF